MTNVYHKTTFSGVCTHFESFLHDSYKIGMVYYTLLNRCFLISSKWSMFLSQLTLLKNLFWKNSYLENVIDIFLKIFLNKTYVLTEKFLKLSWNILVFHLYPIKGYKLEKIVLSANIYDALRNLVPFVQFKNVKNTHGRVLLLVKLKAKS